MLGKESKELVENYETSLVCLTQFINTHTTSIILFVVFSNCTADDDHKYVVTVLPITCYAVE